LVNFVSEEYNRCCFHGITNDLISLQAESLGIPVVQYPVPADMKEYESRFKKAVTKLKQKYNAEGMVFGDIYLDEHKEWVERVCNEIGIIPVEPLWNLPVISIINEFISTGFKSVIVSGKADLFDKTFMGRIIDFDLVNELKSRNICVCGENGEFHSFVIDGPIFNKKIEILESEPVLKEGFWKHWFLDIKKYK
jgi:uncharacterized protein (TIGR00290 family)